MATESPIDTLFREAQELRDKAIGKAIEFRKQANERSPGSYGSISRWTHPILQEQGEFDASSFIEKNADAYRVLQQTTIDVSAIRVPQRGIASLNGDEIFADKKLGTDNLQQCVAVVAHGFTTSGEEKAILMHVDKYTSPEAVHDALSKFENNKYLRVIVYGGKDQYRKTYDSQTEAQREDPSPRREVSLDNLRIVDEAIAKLGLQDRVDQEQSKRGRDVPSSNFIYHPNQTKIIEGLYPNGGFEVAEATERVRRGQNLSQGREFDSSNVAAIAERKLPLQEIPTGATSASAVMDPHLEYRLLKYYKEHGCEEFKQDIEDTQSQVRGRGVGDKEKLMQSCSSCQNFMVMMKNVLHLPAITMQEILQKPEALDKIVSEKTEQIQRNIVLKRQLKEVGIQVDEQPTPKDMSKEEVRLLASHMIKSLAESERQSALGTELKEIDRHLAQSDINKKEIQRLSKSAIARVEGSGMQHFR